MWKKKMENKHEKKHSAGAAFLWGFILGAIFASLLTTKKGRAILRELVNTGMELIDDFIEERKNKAYEKSVEVKNKIVEQVEKEEVEHAEDDLDSEITSTDSVIEDMEEEIPASSEKEADEFSPASAEFEKNGR